jgi:hypothetical protein
MQNSACKRFSPVIGFRRSYAASLFCLLALAAQILLPFVHFHQVDKEEHHQDWISRTGSDQLHTGGQELDSDAGKGHHHPHHECCSCPICQYLFCAQSILVQDAPRGSLANEAVELLPLVHLNLKTTLFYLCTGSPRSPPYI